MNLRIIKNPILPGFNPDPSILRVGDDYFIATSTFEWFPGVQIHQSRDLVHWRLLTRPLIRLSQLDMTGNPDSGGIWAPCLSYSDGIFFLVYTDVKVLKGPFKDTHNYLVTAPDITGPWSDPVYLNASGFDPSLFHDDDGRKWLVNMLWDYRKDHNSFAGIVLQEYSHEEKKLVGPVTDIFKGTGLGYTEGPHLYKRNGFYYLMTAEGGTGYNHAVTMARSRSLTGPYEVDPQNPMLTSRDTYVSLQKAGHGSLVELPTGETYLAHLCGRPVGQDHRCILGRETAIQKCHWTHDGWLRLENGGNTPEVDVSAPNLPEASFEHKLAREDFDSGELPLDFQSLRIPADSSWVSLTERPGWLRLYGQESTTSRHRQSLLARRIESVNCRAATCLQFEPENFQQVAGLIAIYDVMTHYYLCVIYNEKMGKCLRILAMDKGQYSEPAGTGIAIGSAEQVYLQLTLSKEILQFAYSFNGINWEHIGPALDATKLSDDYCGGFTGAFVGICAQDLSGRRLYADFDWFEYGN